jgi:peroxygenase
MTIRIQPSTPARPRAAAPQPRPAVDKSKFTPLQRHVDFFDRDQDGVIKMGETRQGLRALGAGQILAAFGALFINGLLGPKTAGAATTKIEVAKIAGGKHDSDTDVFDEKGNVDPKAFDALFATHDKDKSGSLDAKELAAMRAARKETKVGGIAASAEFSLLLKFCADREVQVDGKPVKAISRDRLAKLYDGTLFDVVAAERAAAAKK